MDDSRPAWASSVTDLNGRTVLLVGGSGGVGEGVLRALLERGAAVTATGRDRGRLDELAARTSNPALTTTTLDALDPDLDTRIHKIAPERGFDAVVVSLASWGGQGRKTVLQLTDSEWDALVAANQTAIFRLYRSSIPLLAPQGALVQLNGVSADIPFPGNGGRALAGAAVKSMTRTVAAELEGSRLRIYEVILGMIRTRERQLAGIDNPGWIDGTDVGAHVSDLIAGTSPLSTTVLQYLVSKHTGPQADVPQFIQEA